jgi:hypothetical protein
MAVRVKKLQPALKHGGYSVTGLLPGEDAAAFEQLHRELKATYCPAGPLEEHAIATIGNLLWRRQNLGTIRRAEAARKRYLAIRSEMIPSAKFAFELEYLREDSIPPDPAEVEAATKAAEERAQQELGEDYKLAEMGDLATSVQLLADLEVEGRLDARIEKLGQGLMRLKTFKSLLSATPPSSAELPRLSAPKKAA